MGDPADVKIPSGLESCELSQDLAPVLIGHDAEVKQILNILDKRAPHLIVVTGEAGVGKTSLLHLIRSKAAASGWSVMPRNASEEFAVSRDTTEATFCLRIDELLAIPTGESFIETKSSRLDLHPIVKQLRERAPILILIDGFDASDEFAVWFSDQFIKGAKQSRSPIVVTAAVRSANINQISPVADEMLSLGRVNKQSIRDHFERVGKLFQPPMDTAELTHYVDAAYENPDLLGSLTRVLRLASLDQ